MISSTLALVLGLVIVVIDYVIGKTAWIPANSLLAIILSPIEAAIKALLGINK
jgi:hypothetical protein